MIKVYKENENGKIELTKEELEELLKESYNEGYNAGKSEIPTIYPVYPYTSPITPTPT